MRIMTRQNIWVGGPSSRACGLEGVVSGRLYSSSLFITHDSGGQLCFDGELGVTTVSAHYSAVHLVSTGGINTCARKYFLDKISYL